MSDPKNRKKIWMIAVTCLLVGVGFGASHFFFANNFSKAKILTVAEQEIAVELALTPQEQSQGLSGRSGLCTRCGMLFVFEKKDAYKFWMKDMQFDLDMVWIDGMKIVQIDRQVPFVGGTRVVRSPKTAVDKVLEISAGESDRLGIKEGDEIKF